MRRRRTPARPDAGRDWRALATPPAQRELSLPATVDGVPDESDAARDDGGEMELRLRRDDAGTRVVFVASITYRDPAELRRLAGRLHDAADALGKQTDYT